MKADFVIKSMPFLTVMPKLPLRFCRRKRKPDNGAGTVRGANDTSREYGVLDLGKAGHGRLSTVIRMLMAGIRTYVN
jgi:hypothetical protein